MPGLKSKTILTSGAGTAIVALLAMLPVGCHRNSLSPADAAVDAPQGSTSTSTGTGSTLLTGTASGPGSNTDTGGRTIGASSTMTSAASLTSTARETATGTGSASTGAATATGTATAKVPDWTSFTMTMTGNLTGITTGTLVMTATATPTATVRAITSGTMVYTDIVATTNTTTKTTTFICYPSTAAPTATSTGVTTGTGRAVCATWNTITLFRRNGLGFCPAADTASSVIITRTDDGSLVLGGKVFRADAAGTSGCVSTFDGVCLVTKTIPETTLTPAQSEQLLSLLSAMPPGSCPHSGACDPCLITTLTVDDNSEADWEGCCTDPSGPGTHRAGYRAVVAFIDSLLPATTPNKGDASADGSTGGTTVPPSSTTGPAFPPRFVGNIDTQGKPAADFVKYWDQLTPEAAGKWPSVQPSSGDKFNWTVLDTLYAYAEEHKIPFKESAFVWGSAHPSWIGALTTTTGPDAVKRWMKSFCDRYPNTRLIDVVNEPPPHTSPSFANVIGGGSRTTWDWVINSFKWAREACPNAVLLLNDYNIIEYSGDNQNIIDLVKVIKQAGAPIDAIGSQTHGADKLPSSTLKPLLDKLISDTGLPVYITEYDIGLVDDEQQRAQYADHIPMFWDNPKVKGVTVWGYGYGSTFRASTNLFKSDGSPRPAMTWLMGFLKR